MVEVLDIDRAALLRMGAEVFPTLERGTIIYVRAVDEIRIMADRIVAVVAERYSAAEADEVRALFETGKTPGHESLVALLLVLRELRDSRYMSCLFTDLIAGFGLPAPTLIDTGYFRCVFQQAYQALRADKRLPNSAYEKTPGETAEHFLVGKNQGGHPHRDIDVVHYTFQMNFWFPMHDIPVENSLVLLPEIYKADVPYQQAVENLTEPDRWGYGKALRRAMRLGDLVLFHSQHFHASPSEAPKSDRVTAELRIASACIDDNANAYRRLFWRSENFVAFDDGAGTTSTPASRAARLFPRPDDDDGQAATVQEIFARLFKRPEDARHASVLWSPESVFAVSSPLPDSALADMVERLTKCPFAEDRQLAFARYLNFHGKGQLAGKVLADTLNRTESYFFALEIARLAGAAKLWTQAGNALLKAGKLAQSSSVQIGRYRGDVPARPLSRIQFMPEDAQLCVPFLILVLQQYLASPKLKPAPMLDYRLFFPFFRAAHPIPHCDGAVAQVRSLLVYVPEHRLEEVGLRGIGDKAARHFEGEFNPKPIVRDPTGTILAYHVEEMADRLRQARIVPG